MVARGAIEVPYTLTAYAVCSIPTTDGHGIQDNTTLTLASTDGDKTIHTETQKTQRDYFASSLPTLLCIPTFRPAPLMSVQMTVEIWTSCSPEKSWEVRHGLTCLRNTHTGCRVVASVLSPEISADASSNQLISVRLISGTAHKLPPLLRFGRTGLFSPYLSILFPHVSAT